MIVWALQTTKDRCQQEYTPKKTRANIVIGAKCGYQTQMKGFCSKKKKRKKKRRKRVGRPKKPPPI
jgi:hypothetical protein